MKNIAVILARSGSKGLKDKNIKELCGKPLMAYSIEAALESGVFDCVHVSTDSVQYAEIAKQYGADVPFMREAIHATDTATSWDALRFVMEQYRELGKEFDTVTLLQPTSPLRDANDIKKAFEVFVEMGADSVVSVCEMEHSLALCNTLKEDGCMHGFIDASKAGRRQDMQTYYRLNGAIYIQKINCLMNKKDLYGEKSYAYIMDKMNSVDIDDAFDFMIAETMMHAR